MSPIYTGDKFGFGASTSAGGGGGVADLYNNAGIVFTPAGAYGSAGPSSQNITNEYKDQKFYTENHYFYYSSANNPGGFIFVRAPKSGTYVFEIRGAFGGPSNTFDQGQNKGGAPWYLKGEVDLVGGRWMGVVVGQRGGEAHKDYNSSTGGGGGGGTFLFELDGSESETTLTNSYVESASVTCLLVAAGGNGANYGSWQSLDTPARDETSTGATDWILGAINSGNSWGNGIFGRAGFGGSFNYTPYSTVDAQSGDAQNPRYDDYPHRPRISGHPLLDVNGKIHEYSLWGGVHWTADNTHYRDKNYDPSQSSGVEGAFGGFGGGGGCRYEGGGGGGYWGGAAWYTNQYSTIYNYGAQSYAHPTRVTVSTSRLYGDGTGHYGDELCGLDVYSRITRSRDNGHPLRELHGKLYLCPKAPKATAIGEAVFHADGFNIGDDKYGVGKVTKYDWYVPEGVTSICAISVAGGGSGMARHDGASGGGGALGYKNDIAVTPGQRILVQVGNGGFMRNYNITDRSPKGTDSKITVYPAAAAPNGGSVYFNGSQVIKISSDSAGQDIFKIPGSASYCYEAWIYCISMAGNRVIFSTWDGSGGYHNTLWRIDSNGQIFLGSHGGGTYQSNATSPVTANNWHHVCVASNGNSVEFYIDGVMCGGFNNSNHNESMTFGAFLGANMDGYSDGSGGSQRFQGYISNFRYVVGHKTYDSNFTPPTSPLTPTSQGVPAGACKFLACQDPTDYYANSIGVPMTQDYGSPLASGANPFGQNSPSAETFVVTGGGFGCYASGSSCANAQNSEDKGIGGNVGGGTNVDGGGDGGNGMQYGGSRQGGGGAGGYSGGGRASSGYPSNTSYSGCQGAHGQNGGGGGGSSLNGQSPGDCGGGGGTGIYGQGADGEKGDPNGNGSNDGSGIDFAGKGGSPANGTGTNAYTNREGSNYNNEGARGGMTGYNRWRPNYFSVVGDSDYKAPDGGFPGGGGGGGHGGDTWGQGGSGVVRILWGAGRSFPSTNVDISTTYDSDADVFRIGTQPQY